MDVFQSPSPRLLPAIPLRFAGMPSNFPNRWRVSVFRPLSAIADSRSGAPDSESGNRMFILGMGFVGSFFAQQLKESNWDLGWFQGLVEVIRRRKNGKTEEWILSYFLRMHQSKLECARETVKDYIHLLVSIPPLAEIGDPILRNVQLVRDKLSSGNLRWLCYLSSTSVYGDYGGAWVNEDHLPNPKTQTARLRLAAEEGWLSLGRDLGVSTQILRLGGIYGPGRSAIDTLIKRDRLSEDQKRRASRKFTSRVHVEDICQALQAAIDKPSSREIYNIVDDDPAPREEVFEYASELIEKRWPWNVETKPFLYESQEESSLRGEKRVCNKHMKDKIGVKLLHSSYKSGLQSILRR